MARTPTRNTTTHGDKHTTDNSQQSSILALRKRNRLSFEPMEHDDDDDVAATAHTDEGIDFQSDYPSHHGNAPFSHMPAFSLGPNSAPKFSYPAHNTEFRTFSDNAHNTKYAAGVAAVSPMNKFDTITPNFCQSLSQSSTASSLTFASVAATDSSSVRMDLESSGDNDSGVENNCVSGGNGGVDAMVGSVIGCGGPWYSSHAPTHNIFQNNTSFCQSQCPPTKRARVTTIDEEMSPPSIVMSVEVSNSFGCLGLGSKNSKDIGTTNENEKQSCGRICCHVCHKSSSDSNVSDANTEIVSFKVENSAPSATNGSAAKSSKDSKPKSNSLLSYFRPSSKKQTLPQSQFEPKLHSNQAHSSCSIPTNQQSRTSNPSNLNPCRYCDKPTCVTCTRHCESCERWFCTFCSKVNYGGIVERILCFECDELADSAAPEDEDIDMMDL